MKNQMDVFIVEDNAVFSLALKGELENSLPGHSLRIQTFETGEACKKKFIELKPEVVILDYNLNSKFTEAANGLVILDWIKKENPETNVIMLSGVDNIEIAVKSFKHGAADYVVKTETQFKKINYSLVNLFKMISADRRAKRYKRIVLGMSAFLGVMIGLVIAIQIFRPLFLM